jgi:hypothetical protein
VEKGDYLFLRHARSTRLRPLPTFLTAFLTTAFELRFFVVS